MDAICFVSSNRCNTVVCLRSNANPTTHVLMGCAVPGQQETSELSLNCDALRWGAMLQHRLFDRGAAGGTRSGQGGGETT